MPEASDTWEILRQALADAGCSPEIIQADCLGDLLYTLEKQHK